MQIESIIKRTGGTFVKLGDDIYHFIGGADDQRHVAEVTDPDHIQAFLAVKEGYRIAKPPKAATPADPVKPAAGKPAPAGAPTSPVAEGEGAGSTKATKPATK